jgi:hypothetical protein
LLAGGNRGRPAGSSIVSGRQTGLPQHRYAASRGNRSLKPPSPEAREPRSLLSPSSAMSLRCITKGVAPLPGRRSVLVDLGRIWKALDRNQDSIAALLAASRGGEPRAAELARELLPSRYPYVPEFRRALDLDPSNAELHRELAYLLLRMQQQPEAEREFQVLADTVAEDLLSATQLGFLLYARGERAAAQPLFDRVMAGRTRPGSPRSFASLVRQGTTTCSFDRCPVRSGRSLHQSRISEGCAAIPATRPGRPRGFSISC